MLIFNHPKESFMFKKLGCILFLFFLISSIYAQEFNNINVLKKIGLTDETIEKVIEINNRTQEEIKEAGLELNIFKAQLEKLLFSRDVNLEKVEKLLKDSLEWKLKSEMARIKKRVMIRKLMDEEQWLKLLQIIKAAEMKAKENRQNK